jgi:hypothetical protein
LDKGNGSYTVEAVFVITISLFVIVSIYYAAMFMHDKAVILTVSHYHLDSKTQEESMENSIKSGLEDKLFIAYVKNISFKSQLLSKQVMVDYSLTLSVPLLKKALLGSDGEASVVIEHSLVDPVVMMWNTAVWKGD